MSSDISIATQLKGRRIVDVRQSEWRQIGILEWCEIRILLDNGSWYELRDKYSNGEPRHEIVPCVEGSDWMPAEHSSGVVLWKGLTIIEVIPRHPHLISPGIVLSNGRVLGIGLEGTLQMGLAIVDQNAA